MRGLGRICGMLLVFCSVMWAGSADPHTESDPAHSLYRRSSFVHGYIHGYEEGFHTGDLEIHMGHAVQPLDHYKVYRQTTGYQSRFGDHNSFRRGFQEGFRAGYDDALNGEAFRAVSEIRRAAQGLGKDDAPDQQFDQALSTGYEAGRTVALQHSPAAFNFQYATEHCLAQRQNQLYCDAYTRGFTIGYSDGAVFQHARETQTARK